MHQEAWQQKYRIKTSSEREAEKNKKSASENQIENGKFSSRRMVQMAWHSVQEEGGGCEG